jgi:hypothetical protein
MRGRRARSKRFMMRCSKKEMAVGVGVGVDVAVGVCCSSPVRVLPGSAVDAEVVPGGAVGDNVGVGTDVETASAMTCARGVVTRGRVTTRTVVAVGTGMGAQATATIKDASQSRRRTEWARGAVSRRRSITPAF